MNTTDSIQRIFAASVRVRCAKGHALVESEQRKRRDAPLGQVLHVGAVRGAHVVGDGVAVAAHALQLGPEVGRDADGRYRREPRPLEPNLPTQRSRCTRLHLRVWSMPNVGRAHHGALVSAAPNERREWTVLMHLAKIFDRGHRTARMHRQIHFTRNSEKTEKAECG